MASLLTRALTLGLLAMTFPLAVRGLYGPPGAWVNIRWQPSVDAAERQKLETEWQLVDGREVSPSTWRYDLTASSEGRLRAPRRTGQIRPLVDTANPAIFGVPRRELSSTS